MPRSHRLPLRLFVPFFLVLALANPTIASAEGFYVDFSAGVSSVPDQDLAGGGLVGEVSLEPGFVVGGAFGRRLGRILRIEANLSYRRSDVDELTSTGVVLAGSGDVGVFAAMANVYADFLPSAPIRPYLGVGLGVGVIDVNSDDAANVLIVDDSSVEFAWNLMAGAVVPVSDAISLFGGYRYLATTDPEFDATLVGVGSGTVEGEFDAHEGVAGLRLSF